jgi:hypothetical protein
VLSPFFGFQNENSWRVPAAGIVNSTFGNLAILGVSTFRPMALRPHFSTGLPFRFVIPIILKMTDLEYFRTPEGNQLIDRMRMTFRKIMARNLQ